MENNKLIAEFMGMEDYQEMGEYVTPNYHSSWDWLMSVVEKIRKVPSWDRDKFSTEVVIYGDKTSIKSKGYGEKEHSKSFFNKSVRGKYNSIEPTHKAVIEFIKWYNLNKKN